MNALTVNLGNLLKKQKIRFLLVGSFNTVFGYLMFFLVNLSIGHSFGYIIVLIIAQLISASVAYKFYQFFVFKGGSRGFKTYARFQGVYITPLVANIIALPLLVEVLRLNVYLSQALCTLGWIIASFFVHKNYSFRN